jgi:MGT family glycosyltransferase
MRSSRRYLFCMWEGAGLVAAELAVADQLIRRGHRVTVLADPPFAEDAVAIGAAFRSWERAPMRHSRDPAADLVADWEVRSPFELMRRMRERFVVDPAPAFAADVTAAIADLQPDIVVNDVLLLGAHVAAEASGLPTAALIPNIYLFPAPGSPPFGTGWAPARTPFGHGAARLVDRLTVRLWDQGLPTLNALRADHGLDPVPSVWAQADRLGRVLVLTSPSFDGPARRPANVRHVGPQLGDPGWADGDWQAPPGDEPLVLVALSSGFQDQLSLLRRIVTALDALPVRAVVTTGRAIDPALVAAPQRVQVVRAAPHTAILRQAAAVITHGGHATVLKALAAGVPLVCLPMGRDQADNAARLVRTGAGLRLAPAAASRQIATALQRVLGDRRFADAAAAFAARLRDEQGSSSAVVAELEGLVAPPQAPAAAPVTDAT